MLGLGTLGTVVGRPRESSATSTKRPRVHCCRLPERSCSANNFTSIVLEVFPTSITRATNSDQFSLTDRRMKVHSFRTGGHDRGTAIAISTNKCRLVHQP